MQFSSADVFWWFMWLKQLLNFVLDKVEVELWQYIKVLYLKSFHWLLIITGKDCESEGQHIDPQCDGEGHLQEDKPWAVPHCVATRHLGPKQWVQRDNNGKELRAFHSRLRKSGLKRWWYWETRKPSFVRKNLPFTCDILLNIFTMFTQRTEKAEYGIGNLKIVLYNTFLPEIRSWISFKNTWYKYKANSIVGNERSKFEYKKSLKWLKNIC